MTVVRSQTELDAAIDADDQNIIVDSPAGVWLALDHGHVSGVRGESQVGPVWGSATVSNVRGSATVSDVRGSATVSNVRGSATVSDVWGSATVRDVWGSATVRDVWGSATVSNVWGSATVRDVWGSATVSNVRDSATVSNVRGSATVRDVWGSATVSLGDNAAATNVGKFVAVHLHSAQATTDGGVIIDVSGLDLTDPHTWCEYHGVTVTDGNATVYKAVDNNFHPQRGTQWTYRPGATVTCDDWKTDPVCGHGLHVSPRPVQARGHFPDATRFVECTAPLTDLVPLGGDKCKAPAVVCVREVDVDGQPIGGAS